MNNMKRQKEMTLEEEPPRLAGVQCATVEKWSKKYAETCLWKSYSFAQSACGKKVVAALRQIWVFHIIFPYYYNY